MPSHIGGRDWLMVAMFELSHLGGSGRNSQGPVIPREAGVGRMTAEREGTTPYVINEPRARRHITVAMHSS